MDSNKPAIIHMQVPPALKGRWVALSRKEGMKLTDWIVQKVEGKNIKVLKVSDSLDFKGNT